VLLQGLPLGHQVADFPHQGLVPIARLLRGSTILIEAWRRHRPFELLDLSFALGDPTFEVGDALLQRVLRLLLFSALGLFALTVLASLSGDLWCVAFGSGCRCTGFHSLALTPLA
jgi:hypothetical protein